MALEVATGFGTVLKDSILSIIGGQIKSAALEVIIGPQTPGYFSEVYKEIGLMLDKPIASNTVDEIEGKMIGMANWYKNEYMPRTESDVLRDELFSLLQHRVADFYVHAIAVLQQPEFAAPSLGVFVRGATMHLLFLRELAKLDPTVYDPNQSSYVTSLRRFALDYSHHAKKYYKQICDATDSKIWEELDSERKATCLKSAVETTFLDFGPAFGLGLSPTPARKEKLWKGFHQQHKSKTSAEIARLNQELNQPLTVAEIWKKEIADVPFPRRSLLLPPCLPLPSPSPPSDLGQQGCLLF